MSEVHYIGEYMIEDVEKAIDKVFDERNEIYVKLAGLEDKRNRLKVEVLELDAAAKKSSLSSDGLMKLAKMKEELDRLEIDVRLNSRKYQLAIWEVDRLRMKLAFTRD